MKHTISILNPVNDNMGASFQSLLNALEQFNQVLPGDEIILNLEKLKFVHPFLILPLCSMISDISNNNVIIHIQYNIETESYLNTIKFPFGFNALLRYDWGEYLSSFRTKTYLPICKIPVDSKNNLIREKLLSTFENILLKQLNISGQMVSVIKYLTSEAMDNIVEHAKVENGWIMVQNYPNKGFIDICILDSGIGLLG